MNSRLSLAEQDILLSIHEESPLWEIAASLSDRINEPDQGAVRARVVEMLRRFAERGWIDLGFRRNVGSKELSELVRVPIERLDAVLENAENWKVQTERPEAEFDHYILSPTPAAIEFVRAGGVDDVWPGLRPNRFTS